MQTHCCRLRQDRVLEAPYSGRRLPVHLFHSFHLTLSVYPYLGPVVVITVRWLGFHAGLVRSPVDEAGAGWHRSLASEAQSVPSMTRKTKGTLQASVHGYAKDRWILRRILMCFGCVCGRLLVASGLPPLAGNN